MELDDRLPAWGASAGDLVRLVVPDGARFLDLVTERHGPLASLPLNRVAGIAATLAPLADLNTGAARTALRKAVLAARNGGLR